MHQSYVINPNSRVYRLSIISSEDMYQVSTASYIRQPVCRRTLVVPFFFIYLPSSREEHGVILERVDAETDEGEHDEEDDDDERNGDVLFDHDGDVFVSFSEGG
jgi:hypothetical protein